MDYELIRSQRRTLSLEIKPDGRLVVKAPLVMSTKRIHEFIEAREDWIEKTRAKVLKKNAGIEDVKKLSPKELTALKKKARELIEPLLEDYSEIMGCSYGQVAIRAQKTRWGSCSGKKNLNFNCLLALCPEAVMRYVVVHELCHLKYMNHSKAFWNEVEEYMPDYKIQRAWLRKNGDMLIARI